MATSHWHKLYRTRVGAPPAVLFGLLSDLPNYKRWLPTSGSYAETTDVEPYPVALGSRYRDGRPGEPGKDWWGTVTGFQPPGSLDFHHTIHVQQLRATIETHIHYSFEPNDDTTQVTRWLVLDITMPVVFRPLRRLITRSFDRENRRTMAAVKSYAEAHPKAQTICEFGFPGPLRDRLVEAVLSGVKTATSSLLAEWEKDGEHPPVVGELQTVIDSAGVPVAVIEIVASEVVSLGAVDDRVARAEGEDYQTAAGWRSEHERFWREEVFPGWEGDVPVLDDSTPVVVEWFRLHPGSSV